MKNKLDEKFNALWEQCIESQKQNVKYWLQENDKEMVKMHRDILQSMEQRYAEVKIKT